MLGAPVTIAPPTGELISIEAAKLYLRLDDDVLDQEVQMTVASAIGDVEQLTGARLLTQTVRFTADSWLDLRHLRVAPVASIEQVAYRNAAGEDQDLDPASFRLVGAPFEQSLLPTRPLPSVQGDSIEVTAIVGYGADCEAVPAVLLYACYASLRAKFEDKTADLTALTLNHRFF